MSDSDDIQLSAKECQERIDRFVEITNTDEAFAQASLQDVDWNLDAAINAFLGQNMPAASNVSGLLKVDFLCSTFSF